MKTKLGFIFSAYFLLPTLLWAQGTDTTGLMKQLGGMEGGGIGNRPMMLMLGLVAVTLLPYVGMMVTSFVKIAVVLSITRQAIGVQQTPPTTVITGLAIILSVYVMQPVAHEVYLKAAPYVEHKNQNFFDKANVDVMLKIIGEAEQPVKKFLSTQATNKNIQMFYRVAQKMRAPDDRAGVTPNDYLILVPAFVISELTKAFQIGFIIFLPFLVVDMAISNILMALGMQMLSPTTISLPFKILLFVMVDGWYLITKGLVLGYQT